MIACADGNKGFRTQGADMQEETFILFLIDQNVGATARRAAENLRRA